MTKQRLTPNMQRALDALHGDPDRFMPGKSWRIDDGKACREHINWRTFAALERRGLVEIGRSPFGIQIRLSGRRDP